MWLRHLQADRLRNLKAVNLDLDAGLTVIAGRNGQGKTSLLESIYLLATGRSFRTHRLDDLVDHRGGPLRVSASVESRLGRTEATVVIADGERRLLVDGEPSELEAYLGRLDLIALPNERMKVLREGPDERRRFLDRGIVGLDPTYLRILGEYRRTLGQRNALLKAHGFRGDGSGELTAWDERLVEAAARLHRHRRAYCLELAARLGGPSRLFFPDGGELRLRYQPSPTRSGEVAESEFSTVLRGRLERRRRRDLGMGFTTEGPHRDDMILELDGQDLRRYGSSGQIRAAMVAVKLAKLELLKEQRAEAPLFLMDDFDTDLDERRLIDLAAFLEGGGFQAVVATSKESLPDRLRARFTEIRMREGRAEVAA